MRKILGFLGFLAMTTGAGGCAVNSDWIPQPVWRAAPPALMIEGLREQQSGEPWLSEARRTLPPACSITSLKVTSDTKAMFTFSCFQGEA
jgi:hypothetical protein